MKKLTIIFILLAMLAEQTKAQWQTVYDLSLPLLWTTAFKDFNNGIAAGSTLASPAHGIIIRTADNGTTWDTVLVTLSDTKFMDIVYTDTSTIIAVGYKDNYSGGMIARSNDNGGTWDTTVFANTIFSVSFPSENIGYAVGGNGIMYKTIDEGINWTPMPTGSTSTIGSVFFINDTIGFAMQNSLIMKTTDGGNNWTTQNISPNNSFGNVFFPSDSIGYFYSHNHNDSM